MKFIKKQLFLLIFLTGAFYSPSMLPMQSNNMDMIKTIADMVKSGAITVTVKPDLSGISGDIGNQIGRIMPEIIKEGVKVFAQEMSKASLHQDIQKGGSALTKAIGTGAESLNLGMAKDVYPHIASNFRGLVSSIINMQNAVQYGGLIGLGIGLPVTIYYGIPAMWNVIAHKLMKDTPPKIIDNKTKKYGFWDHTTWLSWSKNQEISPLIFNDSVKKELDYIEKITNSIRKRIQTGDKRTTYSNLLLYGEPGTGKTSFARALADTTNMDFLRVTAGSLLQEGIIGIKYFDGLVDMAKNSKYGLILFIDEADALFGDRSHLNQGTDYYTVLSHILAETGTPNNKFMLIAATNHLPAIDKAMQDRFQNIVEMPLPDEKTRIELIKLYAANNLSHLNYKSILTDELINTIAKKTTGL